MSHLKLSIAVLIHCLSLISTAQQINDINPLIRFSNSPIPFAKITTGSFQKAYDQFYTQQQKRIKAITDIPTGKANLSNSLLAFDQVQSAAKQFLARNYFFSASSPIDSIRLEAGKTAEKVSSFISNLFLNRKLYNALVQFSKSQASKNLLPNQEKYLKETLMGFENNGMNLSEKEKKQLVFLNEKIASFENQFEKNISNSIDSVWLSLKEVAGIPGNVSDRWKRNEKYLLYINQPTWRDVLRYADNDSTRYKINWLYLNRATPANQSVLDSILYYRFAMARLLGLKSFANYVLSDKMAGSPSAVWDFLNDLTRKTAPLINSYLSELGAIKKQLHPELPETIFDWDFNYYTNKLLESKYQLDINELREYFELNNTVQGMLTVYERLFGIKIIQIKNIPVWHDKVSGYEVYEDKKKIGTFYMDLFSRKGKPAQGTSIPITSWSNVYGMEILPVAALLCNFPEGNKEHPSLLTMDNATSLFHEFGHVLNHLFLHASIVSQDMFTIKGDFIEAPSQLLENWLYEYEALKIFAHHYRTGDILPKTLFDKMKKSQVSGDISRLISNLYNSYIDFTLHDKYDSIKTEDLNMVAKNLTQSRQIPFVEGTHWINNFIHLKSYPAYYYGYPWSRVYAKDLFSVFLKNGILDTKTGIRYRKEILEKGAGVQEIEMLKKFLGRDPNTNAFTKSLGLN